MRFTAVEAGKQGKMDTLVLFTRGTRILGDWKAVDPGLQERVEAQAKLENFEGKRDEILVFYPADRKPACRIIAAGAPESEGMPLDGVRRAAMAAGKKARALKLQRFDALLPNEAEASDAAHALVEGLSLGAYRFDKYKASENGEKTRAVEAVRVLSGKAKAAARGIARGEAYASAAAFTRDLVNEPAGVLTPVRMAEIARDVARRNRLALRIFDEKQIERMGMGAFRAVSLGSAQPPRFVHLHYRPARARRTVALVGKGITFDSGGLCLKPADGMLDMKADMAGAAAVLGVMNALRSLEPSVEVHGIFPATENMPGGRAYKQRDILRAMNGKTIEVTNTDAEGRLILADALVYASRLKPDVILDMATLTGACVVALGTKISGLFTADDRLAADLAEAGRREGERLWRLPLEEEYFELLKSDLADLKNSAGRQAGAITGALFLKQFVEPKIPWAHLDIAGPAIFAMEGGGAPGEASGVITRTLLRYIESIS